MITTVLTDVIIFIIGGLAGAAIVEKYYSWRFDEYVTKVDSLINKLRDSQANRDKAIAQLEQSINKELTDILNKLFNEKQTNERTN